MKRCTKRARVFENSLNGTLKKDATTDPLHVDYLSMHRVQIRDRTINIDNDIGKDVWAHQEALLVRPKYLCTCRSYFVTGWECSHVVATMTLIETIFR
ncbi:hypothetical protein DVH05_009261 [Phytophthora capsici]|nr:hypothetical protein DVH05_009261 [Phytophthora capsici]